MVRVGGGWDTLDHFLLKHDPCRMHTIAGGWNHAVGSYRAIGSCKGAWVEQNLHA